MIDLRRHRTLESLEDSLDRFWALSGEKILAVRDRYDSSRGAPVFTVDGQYTSQSWTEWTLGFRIGSALIQYDATGEEAFLELGRYATLDEMVARITHFGIHDHGFNAVSTYGNLLRMAIEGRIESDEWERRHHATALRVSGAVQARRWTRLKDGGGFIYSFNGPQSLFVDTIRSLRALALAHQLGQPYLGEGDVEVSLLHRLVDHARTTARYIVYYGEGRDGYDVRGRVAHEAIFDPTAGAYRSASTRQGYSPFSTWTRGLAWAILGFTELLEYLEGVDEVDLEDVGGKSAVQEMLFKAAQATCDFYIESTPTCGVPYWDTAAPGLTALPGHADRPADPFNEYEPVDSSAASIAAQGLLRMGRYLGSRDSDSAEAERYFQAGLRIADTLFSEYMSTETNHQGLVLHSVYHWPNRWDHVPAGKQIACGESTMWGDYHARELSLYLQRLLRGEPYLKFFVDPGVAI